MCMYVRGGWRVRRSFDTIGGFVSREVWFCAVCSVRVQRATTDECEALRIAARVETCARQRARATRNYIDIIGGFIIREM
jgi:hypothetical protein